MAERVMLDSSPLSLLCHPNPTAAGVIEINLWLQSLLAAGAEIFIPEIADYEVRRELLRAGKQKSLRRLGLLIGTLHYVPISTAHMNRAAELWAGARNRGIPTAPPEALDGDVILAAQAESTAAVVATANVTHLSRFVSAKHWRDITQP